MDFWKIPQTILVLPATATPSALSEPREKLSQCSNHSKKQNRSSSKDSYWRMIKACIFDLDGVIVDTAHYHFLAWRRLGQELGIDINEQDNEKLKGVSRMQSLQIILDMGKISLARD